MDVSTNYHSKSKMSSHALAGQIMYYSIAVFLPAIFSLMSSSIYTRIFATGQYGRYTFAITIISFISLLLSQWLQQPIIRYLPGISNSERYEFLRLVKLCLMVMVTTLVCCGLLVLWFCKNTNTILPYIIPATVFICTQIVYSVLSTVVQADLRARRYAYFQSLYSALGFFLSIIIVLWVYRSPVSLVWGAGIAPIVIIPLLYFSEMSFKKRSSHLQPFRKKFSFKKIVSYGMPMMGWWMATNILGVGDRIIVEAFRGPNEVGIYAANYALVVGGVGMFTAPVISASHPFLMKAWASGNEKETAKWVGVIASNILALGFIAIGGSWLLAPFFARLFLGIDFRSGSNIMPIVVAGLVAMSFANYAHKPFEFKERTFLMMFLAIIAAIANLVLNIYLVPHYGYIAAAWTTFACYALYAVLTVVIGQSLLRWSISWSHIAPIACSVIVGLGAARWMLRVFGNHSFWFDICTVTVTYVVISFIPLVLINRRQIRSIFSRG